MELRHYHRLAFTTALALACWGAHAAAPTQFSSAAAEVHDFVPVSSSVGYAGTFGGGLWKTSDAGAHWSKTSLPAKTVWKISANTASGGARLYAATDSGLYRSTDSGSTWTQLTLDSTRAVSVASTSAAGGPDTVLIGVTGVGILRTTDSGATFTNQSGGLDSTDVLQVAFYPGSASLAIASLQCNVEDVGQLRGGWGGVFFSSNANAGTVTWSLANTGLPNASAGTRPCVNALAVNGTSGTPIAVVGILDPLTLQGSIYRTTGTGTPSFSASSNLFGIEWLGPDITSTNDFWAGTQQFGPHRSTDGGVTFTSQANGTTDPDFVTTSFAAGAFTATTWVAGINGIGLFQTTTGGSPWSLPAGPVKADRVGDLSNVDVGLPSWYYMALRNGGVMKSTDSGATWAEYDTGLSTSAGGTNSNFVRDALVVGAHPNNGNVAAVSERTFGLYSLTFSTNTWTMVTAFANAVDHKAQSFVITPGGKEYYSLFDGGAATPGGLFMGTATSTDIGTLSSAGVPLVNDSNPAAGVAAGAWRVRLGASSPETHAYLIMYDSLPYSTTNGGATWARILAADTGFQRLAFLDITEKNSAIVVGSTNKGIYRSIDGGAHFSPLATTGLTQTALSAVLYTPGGVLFGGDFGGQMWCSVDDGATWNAVTGGNLGASIKDMKYLNGAVHVLTDGAGIWKKDGVCS